jgi:hypothetical protein
MAQNPITTATKDTKFTMDGEKRDGARYSSLTGNDETGSRKDDGSKGKANTLCSSLLNKPRGKNPLVSPYGAHKGIGPDDTIEDGYDQLDKLNNWGEFQNLLDDIKERKAQRRIEARQAHTPLIPQKLWKI